MAIEAILDHIFCSVGQDLTHHGPSGAVFFVNLNDRLIFFFGEPGSLGFEGLVVGFVAFLEALGGNKLRVEYFGNLLPVFAVFFNRLLK